MLVTCDVRTADLLGDVAVEVLGGDDGDRPAAQVSVGVAKRARKAARGNSRLISVPGAAGQDQLRRYVMPIY